VGVGGLFDPASSAGLEKHDNDFGRTLGTWGVHPGPYLVLPFLGPSDVRDTLGKVPDGFLSPINYINDNTAHYSVYGLSLLDADARTLLPAYELLESQNPYDLYAFARNAFLQHREYLIHGTSEKSEEEQEEELEKSLEEPGRGNTPNPPSSTPRNPH